MLDDLATDYDRSIHSNPDARAWAALFVQYFPPGSPCPDEGTMLGWFANAMMAMHDHLRSPHPLVGERCRDA